ncbi:MAG: SGNH/GDSL hydrolase family protein, partial [Pirellulaceae bacterium]|nr:SGNH/GDSL hydrolase family protein [Pirellulaceae bacterium]
GGDTARGLENLDKWLGDKPWDVIHFNWGLHDVKRQKNGKRDVRGPLVRTPEDYAKNLDELVRRLKKTDAVLIWAATTPVPEGAAGRRKGDEVALNREAAKIMKKHDVKTNDLYGYILPQLKKTQRPRDVHFTNKGSEILAKKVVEEITAALGRAKSEENQ